MKDERLQNLINNLEEQINNDNLTDINKFKYIYSVFKIKSKINKDLQIDFLNFLKSQNDILLAHDIANFFLSKNIKFRIHYKYVKGVGIKTNLNMLSLVWNVKKQMRNLKRVYNFKISTRKFTDKKKNKDFKQLVLEIANLKKNEIHRLSLDLNIQWKPSHRSFKNDRMDCHDYSWLCFQIIKCKILDKI